MNRKKLLSSSSSSTIHHSLHHHKHNSIFKYLNYNLNRLWRRKFLLILFVLTIFSLILTIFLMNFKLNVFNSLFSSQSSSTSTSSLFYSQLQKFQQNDNNDEKSQNYHQIQDSIQNNDNNNNNQNDKNNPFISSKIYINSDSLIKSAGSDTGSGFGSSTLYNGYIPKKRFVHLDLKGALPKISYFKKLFPLLKKSGANGLLLEYEDIFPYDGQLKFIKATNALNKSDIKELNYLAKINNLEIIPLIQTLGHLEFLLKLQNFRHLRELDEFPQAICPSKNESYSILIDMIDQILALHPDIKRLHIGCDEVYQLGRCSKCRLKDRDDLFLSHVKRIATYLKKLNVIPIIWDDMLRQIPFIEILQNYELDKLNVELMIWTYVDDIYRFIPESTWQIYSKTFKNIWGASAFKGAFGETLTVPNIKMHLENNRAWLRVMEEQQKNFQQLQGLVITGWQRYDHLATLCELLPSGLPSLILNLLTISNGKYIHSKLLKKYYDLLNCTEQDKYYFLEQNQNEKSLQIFKSDPNFFHVSNCRFPGSQIFHLMKEFELIDEKINDYLYDNKIHKAWLTDYNIRHNITNPWRIYEALQEYDYLMHNLKLLIKQAVKSLKEVYDDSTVYEWIEEKLYPQYLRLEKFFNETQFLKKFVVWPKRQLKPSEDLLRILNEKI